LVVLVLIVSCVCVLLLLASARKTRLYPPQEIAMKCHICIFRGEFEKAIASFYGSWGNDANAPARWLTGAKKMDSLLESVERTLGPLEVSGERDV
jgi:hypothetical protein